MTLRKAEGRGFSAAAQAPLAWPGESPGMEPLDLTQRPPRSPRLLLGDLELLMIGRTVDKLRATLPGGNIGLYKIDGFSSRLLKAMGIEPIAALGL